MLTGWSLSPLIWSVTTMFKTQFRAGIVGMFAGVLVAIPVVYLETWILYHWVGR
jgi:hypothetical protein